MQFNQFDLNLLRALDALLSERNVTRAAARLFVTQQAMSGSLGRLRDHFGDQILVKVGRNMELTPLARSLAVPVREALLKIRSALETQPEFDPTTAVRNVRIAMSDYASLIFLPRLLSRLASEAPHMKIEVEGLGEQSFPKLESGDLDFCMAVSEQGLFGNHVIGNYMVNEALFRDDFVCVLDPAQVRVGNKLSLKAYRAGRHSVVNMGRGIETIVEHGWRLAGFCPHIAATAPSFSALIFALPGTPLIATAQRRLAQLIAPGLGLRVMECPFPLDHLREDLLWHSRNEHDPAHIFLRRVIALESKALENSHK